MKDALVQHKNVFIETTALTCAYGLALYLGVKFVMAIV